MPEFMTHDEAHDCFGSKGKTNAALTLGYSIMLLYTVMYIE